LKLKKLRLTNFRNYEDFEIEFNENLNVIVAENGAGKTTILDGVTVALGQFLSGFDTGKDSGFHSDDARLSVVQNTNSKMLSMESNYPIALEASGEINGKNKEWSRELSGKKSKTTYGNTKALREYAKELQNSVRNLEDISLPIISYYGTGRLWNQKQTTKESKNNTSRLFGYDKALEPASTYKEFAKWFEDESKAQYNKLIYRIQKGEDVIGKEIDESQSLKSIRQAVDICLLVSQWQDIRYDSEFQKITVTHPIQGVVPVEYLSDGVRSMLAMTADIAYRCTKLNPHLDNAPKETEGVVMIDEVDLHLHPRWQQTVIPSLQEAFPKIQFIVTTHSPQVLTTVKPQNIQALVLEKGQIKIEKFDFSWGAKSHELLNHILGVDERPQNLEIVKILNEYIKLVDDNLYHEEKALKLREKLDSWGAGKEKELLKADMSIRAKEYRRKKYEKS